MKKINEVNQAQNPNDTIHACDVHSVVHKEIQRSLNTLTLYGTRARRMNEEHRHTMILINTQMIGKDEG